MQNLTARLAAVVIGRNEGERLIQCLQSLVDNVQHIVYVDSGSTDQSVNNAKKLGAQVIALDMAQPFTAARARNAGIDWVREYAPQTEYIQFVDGDCEVVQSWLTQAVNYLDNHSQTAVVCGRRRERYPEKSIYNRLCDIEWNTPIGEAKACGGDALMRMQPLVQVGGYKADLIAGEEPELCVRLRQQGWKIYRLDVEMTLHDAAIYRFAQWWKRMVRAGYAFAAGAHLHWAPPEKHWVKETRRPWFWALLLPLGILGLSIICPWYLLLFAIYPMQMIRIARANRHLGKLAIHYGFYSVVGKFAELQGQFKFIYSLLGNKKTKIIEYKH